MLAAIWSFAFFPILSTRSTAIIIAATVIALATHAIMYGPQAAYVSELFTTKLRFSGTAGYQLGGLFSGAIAPIVSIALVEKFHSAYAVSIYVLAMPTLTLTALKSAPETAKQDLHSGISERVRRVSSTPP